MEKLKLHKVIIAAVILVLAVVFISGILGEDMTYPPKARGGLEPLTASAPGVFGEPVVVEVVADENAIYSVAVTEHNETQGIGTNAIADLPERIVATQSVEIDGTSGATMTSNAIKAAVLTALTDAGIDPANFTVVELAPEEEGEKTPVTLDCDVVIVGAGGAGLTSAVRATQAGAKVLVLEKMPNVGGNSLRAEGGMNAAGTKVQAALGLDDSTVDNYVADTLRLGHDLADPELVRTLGEGGAEAVEWLESIGAPLTKVAATGGTEHKYLHKPEDGRPVGEYLVDKLSAKAEELGIEIMLNTRATEILMDNGKAVGVVAEDKAHIYTVNAKSVVLATGGFGANFELMASYDPTLADAVTTNHSGATGDGIAMAEAVGAATVDMEQIQLHPTVIQSNGLLVSESLRSHGAIIVNSEGKRFVNDMAGRDVVSQAELKQPGAYAYIIFDQALVDEVALTHKFIDGGYALSGDTYEALGKAMGLEDDAVKNFVETMQNWETYVAAGEDKDFGRSKVSMIDISTAPYYAIKIAPGIHHTMGGIKINTSAEVISTEGKVIPGLFACGETTGGIHGGNRVGGNAVADFTIFGSIAGNNAASFAGFKHVDAPEATSKDGTITAADWAETYPYIVTSMHDNDKNSYVTDYLEQDPYLINIYEGYGFAKDYGSARGHEYTLADVDKTQRPHPKANCLTCKSPNFAKLVNDQGVGVYSMPFEEVQSMMEENISCYTCHANNPGNAGQLEVTHSYVNKALGSTVNEIDPATMSCGQCHIEYYFTREDSETMMPYHTVAEMKPEAILAYYDSFDFYDWVQEATGTKMLKAQHPEFETFLQGKHASVLNCADCHMAIEHADDGTVYHSHFLASPLENETLLSTCASCHANIDVVDMVHSLQDRVTARETEVGNKLSELKDTLAKAVSEGKMSEAELDAVRKLHREAQWFFDFCYVENSEGAHNSALAFSCLDTSEAKINEAMALLGT